MSSAQLFSVSLPQELADFVDAKVKSGAYASASEVVREGVAALLERESALEKWLRDEVVRGHEEYLSDPSKGVPAQAVLERIKARRAAVK
ncbi:type II toxin-antitoxin system ParD family antitoxin [Methylocystis sp. JR02]|uniref:type II toxin-antitoxin system ParD family antitoxin n=1 Tax=Methylocystis sp. JR02 TaxID=3046284 RepID=UPI0024BAD202|nr:type II toxin-antitoxin system ParD family antitoxin [Methylocystis sp. JR02]MDJ0449135.1 type II toxin-antitoxin system ParD family antitoxin [Methylocystis sp. JR02]